MTEQNKSKYPSWSDQYSTLVLIQLAKGTDWKTKFRLVDGREGDEFKVTLENGGAVFEGTGSSKKKAEHRAAFKLLKTIRNLREVAKENSLQFLELANKEGAGIISDDILIQNGPQGGFTATYRGRSDLEIHDPNKKVAKKLLVYELLRPLWKQMDATFSGEGQPITPTSSPQRPALRRPNPPPPKPVETTPNAREDVGVLRQPNIRLNEAKPASNDHSTQIEFSTISSSSVNSVPAQSHSSVSRASSIKQKYPEWNTDYYVPILTALGTSVGNSDWKNALKLAHVPLNGGRFSAELVYNGTTYRGMGQGMKQATNDAAFHLVCLLDGLDSFLENNCLAILESAVRHGCTIKKELIELVILSEQEFQCQYLGPDGIIAGGISKSKSEAKKNLVFKLLAPLWKSLKQEIDRTRTHGRDTTTLHDELDKLESQRDEEPQNVEPRNEEPRNEVEPHVYEESLVSGYKTEAPKSADAIDNVIEKAREVLSGLELMRDQIGKNTGPSGDAPPSGYETGQNRSTAATTGEDIVPVSSADSKWASTDLGIDDSVSKICANRK